MDKPIFKSIIDKISENDGDIILLRRMLVDNDSFGEFEKSNIRRRVAELESENTELTRQKDSIISNASIEAKAKAPKMSNISHLPVAAAAAAAESNLDGELRMGDMIICGICQQYLADIQFNCGHVSCRNCYTNLINCHRCGERIITTTPFYQNKYLKYKQKYLLLKNRYN